MQLPNKRFNNVTAVFITPNNADGADVAKTLHDLAVNLGFVAWPEEKSFAGVEMIVSSFSIETKASDFEKQKNDTNFLSKIETAILSLETAFSHHKQKIQSISSWHFI